MGPRKERLPNKIERSEIITQRPTQEEIDSELRPTDPYNHPITVTAETAYDCTQETPLNCREFKLPPNYRAGDCFGAEHDLYLQKGQGTQFGKYRESPIIDEKKTTTIVPAEDNILTVVAIDDNQEIPLSILCKRTPGAIHKRYKYLKHTFHWYNRLIDFYGGEDAIKTDPRGDLLYVGLVFVNCQIEELYKKGGPADELVKIEPYFKDHIEYLEILRLSAFDGDRVEYTDIGGVHLNQKLLRQLHYGQEKWNQWLVEKEKPKINETLLWKHLEILPIIKQYNERNEDNRQKYEERIQELGYQEIVIGNQEMINISKKRSKTIVLSGSRQGSPFFAIRYIKYPFSTN